MASERIPVRAPAPLGAGLRKRSRVAGQTPSHLVRVALENYLRAGERVPSAYKLAESAGPIGCVRHAPKDLSTTPRHLEGFGKSE
ncbi:MAG: hypothetical protein ABSF59_03595 [Candidatus Sulfotelmatobacter sp.]|jgi:hypothetical protein